MLPTATAARSTSTARCTASPASTFVLFETHDDADQMWLATDGGARVPWGGRRPARFSRHSPRTARCAGRPGTFREEGERVRRRDVHHAGGPTGATRWCQPDALLPYTECAPVARAVRWSASFVSRDRGAGRHHLHEEWRVLWPSRRPKPPPCGELMPRSPVDTLLPSGDVRVGAGSDAGPVRDAPRPSDPADVTAARQLRRRCRTRSSTSRAAFRADPRRPPTRRSDACPPPKSGGRVRRRAMHAAGRQLITARRRTLARRLGRTPARLAPRRPSARTPSSVRLRGSSALTQECVPIYVPGGLTQYARPGGPGGEIRRVTEKRSTDARVGYPRRRRASVSASAERVRWRRAADRRRRGLDVLSPARRSVGPWRCAACGFLPRPRSGAARFS